MKRFRQSNPNDRYNYVYEQSAKSRRDQDLMGIDNGQKPDRSQCGEPKHLTQQEIDALPKVNPWGYFWKKK